MHDFTRPARAITLAPNSREFVAPEPLAWLRPSTGGIYVINWPEEHEQAEIHRVDEESEIDDWGAEPVYGITGTGMRRAVASVKAEAAALLRSKIVHIHPDDYMGDCPDGCGWLNYAAALVEDPLLRTAYRHPRWNERARVPDVPPPREGSLTWRAVR